MQKIISLESGLLRLDNREYAQDLIIVPNRIICPWRRKKGHLLQLDDCIEIKDEMLHYRYIVIGCGFQSAMHISKEFFNWMKQNGILYFYGNTADAGEIYNDAVGRGKDMIAMFHLTC